MRDVEDAIPYKLPTNLYGDVCRGKRPRLPEITNKSLRHRPEKTIIFDIKNGTMWASSPTKYQLIYTATL